MNTITTCLKDPSALGKSASRVITLTREMRARHCFIRRRHLDSPEWRKGDITLPWWRTFSRNLSWWMRTHPFRSVEDHCIRKHYFLPSWHHEEDIHYFLLYFHRAYAFPSILALSFLLPDITGLFIIYNSASPLRKVPFYQEGGASLPHLWMAHRGSTQFCI